MKKMSRGFTMIELIFVIVIIGILAVIAIPKLNATRDDAKLVTELQNLSTCVQDIGSAYTATGTEANATGVVSCKALTCFAVSGDGDTDGNITIGDATTITGNYCGDAKTKAQAKQMYGAVTFGGTGIKL